MRILAVDTALGACSAAVLDGARTAARRSVPMQRGHAEALAPMVEEAMREARLAFAALERLAVTTGPGTFTGQRIGLAFMRGLRVALKIPLNGVTSLAVMAAQAMEETGCGRAAAIHDARREEFYVEFAPHGAPQLMSRAEVERALASCEERFALAGSGACQFAGSARAVLSAVRHPDALWVARLAAAMPAAAGVPKPLYLRAPGARLPGARQ
ncbi:MAG TPA: tRNA (adenosine(37)-N6)-threonylcarbamoyltransferase complex dimerization subunit type 1 TsaB [Rhizomicrobium sp.]|nr:tRNA (adenosine(37)-N6)-threonylcarbamoyltransferase complex dimerization subunit type 1 TsaB [Rhizomicrobium sp.]